MIAKAICRILSDESKAYSVLVEGPEDRVEIDCTGRDEAYDLIKAINRNASDVEMEEPEVIDEFKHARQYQGMDLSTGEDKSVVTPAPNLAWTDDQIQIWKDKIDKMTHMEMAHLQRFAQAGHPVFSKVLPLREYFEKRFQALGGMTPEISKAIDR